MWERKADQQSYKDVLNECLEGLPFTGGADSQLLSSVDGGLLIVNVRLISM